MMAKMAAPHAINNGRSENVSRLNSERLSSLVHTAKKTWVRANVVKPIVLATTRPCGSVALEMTPNVATPITKPATG